MPELVIAVFTLSLASSTAFPANPTIVIPGNP